MHTLSRLNPANADTPSRLIVALDKRTVREAAYLVDLLGGKVSFFKVGYHLLFCEGVDGLIDSTIRSGGRIFLDAKMLDIPKTVEEGARRAAGRGVAMLTVHASDVRAMDAAVRGVSGMPTKVIAVTVLTSIGTPDLRKDGHGLNVKELVRGRSWTASQAGCDGVVASGSDDPNAIRLACRNENLLVVTPGIRRAGMGAGDHARYCTPGDAVQNGSDYLVVGRPIAGLGADPDGETLLILAEMARAAASLSLR